MPGAVSKRYAKALLDLGRERNMEESLGEDLNQVATSFADPALAGLLTLSTLGTKARQEIIDKIASLLSLSSLMTDFLRLLAQKDRLRFLAEIQDYYQRLLDQAIGRSRVQVRSAVPLSQAELADLVSALSRLTGTTVVPSVEVDPELLAGVVVEIEGQVYDGSLKTQVARMGKALKQNI
jgi:F-type H+-transporting ATPase subunit delta